jgi:capsular polysaccharide biosynthesis protein
MNLVDYGRILLRRGWIMIVMAFIAAASAFFLSRLQDPTYRAIQRVLIQPARADLGLTESASRLVQQYAVYLDSNFIAQNVIDTLRLDTTAETLNGAVTVAPDALRFIIDIEAEWGDPTVAGDVAREWGNQLVMFRQRENQRNRLEDRIDASLADVARVSLDRPRPTINAAAGGVLGLLVGGVVVFILEYLESAIMRRREDVERTVALPVLASIPDMEK